MSFLVRFRNNSSFNERVKIDSQISVELYWNLWLTKVAHWITENQSLLLSYSTKNEPSLCAYELRLTQKSMYANVKDPMYFDLC